MTAKRLTVSLFVLTLIVALPQLSETIYAPSLPQLAIDFATSESLSEYTLTIYLIGFALGVLVWGTISDRYGRKPCLVAGFSVYILACIGCYLTRSIHMLLFTRLIQAFGASVGSVLGQAVARDAIRPEDRGRVFSTISMAMAFAPGIGPVIGGLTTQFFHWNRVFLVLVMLGLFTTLAIVFRLPETHPAIDRNVNGIAIYRKCLSAMVRNPVTLGYAFMVGAVNGIIFGYYAEAPFFFINGLSLPAASFGLMAFFICLPLALGGWISRRLHEKKLAGRRIIQWGIGLMLFGSLAFLLGTRFAWISPVASRLAVAQSLLWVTVVMTGITMVIPNCLSQALEPYGRFAGTAASLFGFGYYLVIAAFTGMMGHMHDGTLLQLPLFIFLVSALMLLVFRLTLSRRGQHA
ncbi:multidrug effflux MFS transporter [Mesoterricola sediminis]|uniref:multidrug effflux MFS transporter n=1 Tax=Mesoterricola sediminis TaxID=2927980 RepID=UPI00292DFD1E|nr:multidrug effflux MFS transporter [Mesoterricola sediminis]